MKTFSWSFLSLLGLCSLAAADYPFEVNTTTPSAVFFRVFSYDNLNGRSLQLRTQSDGRQIVVIDATSPVLWAEMRKGVIYTQGKTDENIRYSLGPVSHLVNASSSAGTTLQEIYFRNATKADPATGKFVLEIPTPDAVYALYRNGVPDGVANGWTVCKKSDYWQLFYQLTTGNVPQPKGCQSIGVQTTLAPYESN